MDNKTYLTAKLIVMIFDKHFHPFIIRFVIIELIYAERVIPK